MVQSTRDLTIREMQEGEEFAAWLADRTTNEPSGALEERHLVLTDEIGEWIGGLRYLRRGGVVQVVDIGVVTEERGQGHALRLLKDLEDRARESGVHLIEFWTDRLALEPLLAALGWRKVFARRDYIAGNTWYLLEKRLAPISR